ncbi:MAG: hypothetical protein ACRCXG_02965 [Vibrio sp.]
MARNESINQNMLPILMQELIELIGYEDMYILISNYGGQDVYIPKNPKRSKLNNLLPLRSLDILSEEYGGMYLTLPTTSRIANQIRDKEILKHLESGKSRVEVAKMFGLGVRQVANIKNRF